MLVCPFLFQVKCICIICAVLALLTGGCRRICRLIVLVLSVDGHVAIFEIVHLCRNASLLSTKLCKTDVRFLQVRNHPTNIVSQMFVVNLSHLLFCVLCFQYVSTFNLSTSRTRCFHSGHVPCLSASKCAPSMI
jgi:hypothetical protein